MKTTVLAMLLVMGCGAQAMAKTVVNGMTLKSGALKEYRTLTKIGGGSYTPSLTKLSATRARLFLSTDGGNYTSILKLNAKGSATAVVSSKVQGESM